MSVIKSKTTKSKIVKINDEVWVGKDHFLVIAGPCSVESYDQLMEIALEIKKAGGKVLRGGAFKPRTSPESFQGLGLEGLQILRKVADQCGLLVCSELMNERYLDQFLAMVDIIQVGARNMQNYDLLKALGKTKKPILLKRAVGATIDEWLASAQYLIQGGNSNVILCERGIRTFNQDRRYTLDLTAVLALRTKTNLPVIIDPSHATGVAAMVPQSALASLAIGANGLMIEVHHDPRHALSDGPQSITPTVFETLMKDLAILAPLFGLK